MSHDNNTKMSENAPSQWAQIMGEIVNKLSATTDTKSALTFLNCDGNNDEQQQ
jgi:hypothetical protein